MVNHGHISIERILAFSDEDLEDFTGMDPAAARLELEERKEKGELLIGTPECVGFDPVTGCPGHE